MTAAEPCAHCDLPIPEGERVCDAVDGRELAFCCVGCAGAYRIVTGLGLESFYRRRRWAEAGTPEGAFEASFDDARLEPFVTRTPEGAELAILVDGIRCAACVWLVERVLERVPGVEGARVNFATHRALVRFDPGSTSPAALLGALARVGYAPRPFTPGEAERAEAAERRGLLLRFGTAAFLSSQLMGFSLGLYAGYFQGMEAEARSLLTWLSWAAATPVVFYGGSPFLRGALRSLVNRAPGMDLLISLGVAAAYGMSLYALAVGGEVYFDTAAMIVTLLLLGRLLEHAARRRARSGIDRLLRLLPDTAHRLEEGRPAEVPTASLAAGDLVLVRPGDRFPADGEVTAGETEVDEAAVSGEARPVARGPGSPVTSGTLNLVAAVTVRVTAAGAEAFVGRIARLVEEAQARRAPVQRLADRAASAFVPLVGVLAAATWAGWRLLGAGAAEALAPAVAVLVIACPCALGLATPLAILVATGAAARRGILFRGGDVLEALGRVELAALDKTGTLTRGRPRVAALEAADGDEGRLLALAAAVEAGSSHPLARAVCEEAARRGIPVRPAEGATTIPGRGAEAVVEGAAALVGSRAFLEGRGVAVPALLEDEALTELHVAVGGRWLGSLLLADELRPEAPEAVAALQRLGLATVLLTGDRPSVAGRVAGQTGIGEVRAGLTPEDKARILREAAASGRRALMAGDGINDAPALAAAAVGCSLAGGTAVALEASDLVLTSPRLDRLPEAVALARRTLRVVRQNLAWAFGYNVLALPLAAAGRVAPVHAAAAMVLSSACVLVNSLRLAGRRRPREMP